MTRHFPKLRANSVRFSRNDPLKSATRETNKYAQNCEFVKPAICLPLRLQPSSSLGSAAEALKYFLSCITFALSENTIQNMRSITLHRGSSAASHPFWRRFWQRNSAQPPVTSNQVTDSFTLELFQMEQVT